MHWSDVSSGNSYTLDQADNAGLVSPTEHCRGRDAQITIGNQTLGTWYYGVQASDAAGDSPWRSMESVVRRARVYVLLIDKRMNR